jgi:hypothetical protein
VFENQQRLNQSLLAAHPEEPHPLDITYYFEFLQSFNFSILVGTFIARVYRNHRAKTKQSKNN